MLFLTCAFQLGEAVFFLHYIRGPGAKIEMMFWGFRCYAPALGAFWWMALLVLGWIAAGLAVGALGGLVAYLATGEGEIALIAGAIMAGAAILVLVTIAQLRYALTWVILADNPRIGAIEAVRRSTAMMRGHKLRLFAISLVIGVLYVPAAVIVGGGIALAVANQNSPEAGILVAVVGGLLFIAAAIFISPWASTTGVVFYQDLLPPPTVGREAGIAPVGGPANPYAGPVGNPYGGAPGP